MTIGNKIYDLEVEVPILEEGDFLVVAKKVGEGIYETSKFQPKSMINEEDVPEENTKYVRIKGGWSPDIDELPSIVDIGAMENSVVIPVSHNATVKGELVGVVTLLFNGSPPDGKKYDFNLLFTNVYEIIWPDDTKFVEGAMDDILGPVYQIACSMDSSGVVTVYGVLDKIKVGV